MGKITGLEMFTELGLEVPDGLRSLVDERLGPFWNKPAAPGNPRPGGLATRLFGSQEPH